MRTEYNKNRDPIVLLYLIARCVKNAIRFNKSGDFTQSVDKRRTGVHPDKLANTMQIVSGLLKGRTKLYSGDFADCIAKATPRDLVYMDPPYHGTTYGSDKRYVAQLERDHLIDSIRWLNVHHVPFILSYDGTTGDKVYADPLPDDLHATHLQIHAGRSSQATLAGRKEETIESLYISGNLAIQHKELPDYSQPTKLQTELFA
jgi:DNA adenine methylase